MVELKVFAGARENRYLLEVADDANLHTLLEQARKSEGLQFAVKSYPGTGAFLTGLSGKGEDRANGLFWQFCLNGRQGQAGIDDQPVGGGDQVEFHLTAKHNPCE